MFTAEEKRKMLMAGVVIGLSLIAHHILGNWNASIDFVTGIMGIFSPVVVGFVIFYIINIPMMSIEKRIFKSKKLSSKLKRGLALIVTLILFFLFLTIVTIFAIPQLVESIARLVSQSGDIADSIGVFFTELFQRFNLSEDLIDQAQELWTGFLGSFANIMLGLVNSAKEIVQGFLSGIFNAIISIALAVYMLLGKEHLGSLFSKLWHAYSPEKVTEPTLKYLAIINKSFEDFIRGQLMEALVLGIVCYIGMLIFGFEYAVLISFLVGITNIIPLFGPYIGAVPSFLLLLGVNPIHALWFLVYVTVLQQLESNLIYPRVVGSAMGISGFWIMIAVITGNSLFGIAGILLGIPLMSSLYVIIKEATEKRLAGKEAYREMGVQASD